jgi:hypothetical protein
MPVLVTIIHVIRFPGLTPHGRISATCPAGSRMNP